jgi:acyl-CoA thioesterase FadM
VLPEGARALEPALRIEAPAITFGLVHTDSNQHVNSLVYPQLFEEFAIRRLASHGERTPVLARALEIAYRKPCFAGDRVHVALRTYELDGSYGAVGVFVNADEAPDDAALAHARPHAYVWMRFDR